MQAIIAASIPSDQFSKKDEGNDKAGIRKRCGRSSGWHIGASGGGRGRESCCTDQRPPLGYGNRTSRQNSKQGRFSDGGGAAFAGSGRCTRSEEHTSELQSLMRISYAVFCLTKKKKKRLEKNEE